MVKTIRRQKKVCSISKWRERLTVSNSYIEWHDLISKLTHGKHCYSVMPDNSISSPGDAEHSLSSSLKWEEITLGISRLKAIITRFIQLESVKKFMIIDEFLIQDLCTDVRLPCYAIGKLRESKALHYNQFERKKSWKQQQQLDKENKLKMQSNLESY